MSSKASSDPVDLEKGVTGLSKEEEEEELPALNPRKSKSKCIKLLLLDAVSLLYVLFFVGFTAWAIIDSNVWWDSLLAIFIVLLIVVGSLWLLAKMKEECIQGHDTEASDDSDLSTKLLVASSNKN